MKKIAIVCQPNTLIDLVTCHENTALVGLISAGYEYSLASIKYNHEYFKCVTDHEKYQDASVCVYLNEIPVAFFPLYIQQNRGSFFGQSCQFFEVLMSADDRILVYRQLAKFIKKQLKHLGVNSLLVKENSFFLTYFLSNIANISPIKTMSVDLNTSVTALKTNLRKSYKSLVSWGKNNLTCITLNQDSPCKDKFNDLKKFHIEVAEKKTRSDYSWSLQFEMILSGEAMANLYYLDNALVAGNLILLGKQHAFYGVGVYDRTLMTHEKRPLSHWPLLDSIYKCKELGLKTFELGTYSSEVNDLKLKQISDFKKGFATNMKVENTIVMEFTHD